MAPLGYDDKPEEIYQYDLDDWTIICRYCLKNISATRPPVYKKVNCDCSELGIHAAGPNSTTQMLEPKTTVYGQPAYTYQISVPGYACSCTQTSISHEEPLVHDISNNSQDLNINWNNGYLKNNTRITQNQPYSVQSYSWPLHAWLKETESSYTLSSTIRNCPRVCKTSSMKAKNGSKRGNFSLHSSGSGIESGLKGWDPDAFTEVGAWVSENTEMQTNTH
ncbi:hypothetical protein SBOR_8371 [Sclerotinia borealis F-4128]|uniref:Uncharacterized protein n=1 Tax=Sclerotinia borealis (strain F-4128) TaxID=1432307 RepID=W9C8R6_SCLBF|nr:hypothetical protein SBOR_8371 [Sclerotinia borealis F-4128]